MAKVLILGGGFLGSFLEKSFDGDVTLIDRRAGFDILENPDMVEERIKESDFVILLAGGGGPRFFLENKDAIRNALRLASETASACGRNGKPLIFASSSAVYGTYAPGGCFSEESDTVPDEVYGLVKLAAEHVIKSKASHVILRLSNMYGMSEKFLSSGVIGKFIQVGAEGKRLQVNGSTCIDYVHLQDVADAISTIIEKRISNETINIGGGAPVSVEKLAELVCSSFAEKGLAVGYDVKPGENAYADKSLDISKAKRVLGWEPKVNIAQGISSTVEEYLSDVRK